MCSSAVCIYETEADHEPEAHDNNVRSAHLWRHLGDQGTNHAIVAAQISGRRELKDEDDVQGHRKLVVAAVGWFALFWRLHGFGRVVLAWCLQCFGVAFVALKLLDFWLDTRPSSKRGACLRRREWLRKREIDWTGELRKNFAKKEEVNSVL